VAVLTAGVDYFTMLASHGHKDAAHVAFYASYYYYYYRPNYALTFHISRIYFSSSTDSVLEFEIKNVQQLVVENCTFQGVQLYLSQVANAMILQTCFYNGSGLSAYSSSVNMTRCTFRNNIRAVHFSSYSSYVTLTVSESTFINNSLSYSEGAAMYIRLSSNSSVLVNASIFVNNTAVTGEGGALYLTGDSNAAAATYITGCTFIYNSATSSNCGAISAQDININVTNSNFYYNRANGDGGVACVRSAEIDISKSAFIQNIAVGNGGALLLDESNMHINSTLFKNNRAGQDGGALATYIYPSTYTIIRSTFTDNHAEDDGGAVFIGCAESILRVSSSTFNNNKATDRGGAITLYGGRIDMITTNVYDNMADLGNSMCTCSSEVNTSESFPAGQGDTIQPECTNYDANINYHDLPLVQEQGYPDIIHLSTKYWETSCSRSTENSLYGELRRASATAYTAVTISVTLALALLLYIIVTKAFQYRRNRPSQATFDGALPAVDQGDPLYDEARVDYTPSKTDTRDIEMMPNVVYGKHPCN
jgi:predicted outer membrane repeat protein